MPNPKNNRSLTQQQFRMFYDQVRVLCLEVDNIFVTTLWGQSFCVRTPTWLSLSSLIQLSIKSSRCKTHSVIQWPHSITEDVCWHPKVQMTLMMMVIWLEMVNHLYFSNNSLGMLMILNYNFQKRKVPRFSALGMIGLL